MFCSCCSPCASCSTCSSCSSCSTCSKPRMVVIIAGLCNFLLLLSLIFLVIEPGSIAAFACLDCLLLGLAAAGISARTALLIVPNIIAKFVLLIMMLFIACIAFDTSRARSNLINANETIIPSSEDTKSRGAPLRIDSLVSLPFMPILIFIFAILLVIEVRLFFVLWYRLAFNIKATHKKKPPSYAYCISHKEESLPTYEQAIKREQNTVDCVGDVYPVVWSVPRDNIHTNIPLEQHNPIERVDDRMNQRGHIGRSQDRARRECRIEIRLDDIQRV